MRYGKLGFLLVLVPGLAMAQAPAAALSSSEKGSGDERLNVPTRVVLLANRPADMPEADWLQLMGKPVNRTLYPLCITQGMLDTLDVKNLDMRYKYEMVKEVKTEER